MTPEKQRRFEEIEVQINKLDEAVSELHDEAFAFSQSGRAAERADRFLTFYERNEVLPRIERTLSELAQIDPDRENKGVWADVMETKGLLHSNCARQAAQMRMEFEKHFGVAGRPG